MTFLCVSHSGSPDSSPMPAEQQTRWPHDGHGPRQTTRGQLVDFGGRPPHGRTQSFAAARPTTIVPCLMVTVSMHNLRQPTMKIWCQPPMTLHIDTVADRSTAPCGRPPIRAAHNLCCGTSQTNHRYDDAARRTKSAPPWASALEPPSASAVRGAVQLRATTLLAALLPLSLVSTASGLHTA